MLHKDKHRVILVRLLREIYSEPTLRNALGFKGGTAAALIYNLPRFSVDLDFDLLKTGESDKVFARLEEILSRLGKVNDAVVKKFTLFFLLSYGKDERNIKIEIFRRATAAKFVSMSLLGIPLLVMNKAGMAASKLAAFLTRQRFASRDMFDLWFFLNEDWPIDIVVLKEKTGQTLKKALGLAVEKVGRVKKINFCRGWASWWMIGKSAGQKKSWRTSWFSSCD